MEGAAALVAAIGGLITAITTGVVALVKSRRNDVALTAVTKQVTPRNGEPLAAMVEEMLEHLRSTSRRVDLHDDIIQRIARRLDER